MFKRKPKPVQFDDLEKGARYAVWCMADGRKWTHEGELMHDGPVRGPDRRYYLHFTNKDASLCTAWVTHVFVKE